MANENETVDQVCDYLANNGNSADEPIRVAMPSLAERILAAHQREIADFQRRYDECVRRFNEADLERVRLRDEVAAKDAEILSLKSKIDEYERQPELMADVATKALALIKRQDAEIADLKDKNTEAFKAVLKRDKEIASLRALVKESIELLKKVNEVEFVDVTAWFDGCVDAEQQEWLYSAIDAIHKCQLAFDGIIAKAREVCNG